jgi:hypothetical protein
MELEEIEELLNYSNAYGQNQNLMEIFGAMRRNTS